MVMYPRFRENKPIATSEEHLKAQGAFRDRHSRSVGKLRDGKSSHATKSVEDAAAESGHGFFRLLAEDAVHLVARWCPPSSRVWHDHIGEVPVCREEVVPTDLRRRHR